MLGAVALVAVGLRVAHPRRSPPSLAAPALGATPTGRYVGSKTCGTCHPEQLGGWSHDWHARALSRAIPPFLAATFEGAHFDGGSSEAWTFQRDQRPLMRTRGADGALGEYPVSWVVGGKRMQDMLTARGNGAWQVLPVYFHVTGGGGWVDYTEAKQGPLDPTHPFFWTNFRRTANRECLDCHTTGLDLHYDRRARRWSTQFADAGVACESCHGPGAEHAEAGTKAAIVHPGKVAPAAALALCAQCHGPREPLFPLLDAARRFVPGDDYADHYRPLLLVTGVERSGDFFEDGRPKSSSFEYQALIQSRCHRVGKATCLTCHTAPHQAHGEDELPPPRPLGTLAGDASCRTCHRALVEGAAEHSHHRSPEGQSCSGCHMPKVVTGVLDAFADHALDVPAPENTVRHGIPNACNLCHANRSAQSMAKAMARWWPSAATRTRRRLLLADAFAEGTAAASRAALEAVLADRAEAPTLRAVAIDLLANRFAGAAAPTLLPLLGEEDALLRATAAEALGRLKQPLAAESLARLSGDPSTWVRQAAAISLTLLLDPRAEAALRALTLESRTEGLPRPHSLLGLLLAKRGATPEALSELERSVDLQPYSVDGLRLLSTLYGRRGEGALARERLTEALEFDPQLRASGQAGAR